MISINVKNHSYICPFCGYTQTYDNSVAIDETGFNSKNLPIREEFKDSTYNIFTIKCRNINCRKISVAAINLNVGKQVDILPRVVIREYPDYIPEQIKQDYREASLIIEDSPRACATLLRRCLQGMIHDYWGIHEKNLNAEITKLKEKIPPTQWAAIDGLRKIGNIGAHMEQDVNLIIDIDIWEARQLIKLIELLFDKWYIAKHDEEMLLESISDISRQKEEDREADHSES